MLPGASSSSSSSSSSSIVPSMGGLCEWLLDPTPICDAVNAVIGRTATIQSLIPDLVNLVVSYLQVNKGMVFGPENWEAFCGRVGPAPVLPHNIENIWLSACPIFPGKKVYETHMFVYIPKTVNEKPLTLKSFGEIAKRYFPTKDGYGYMHQAVMKVLGDKSIEQSSWVLMTKGILPGSGDKSYAAQASMVVELAERALATYEVPRTLEATVCIMTQYFNSSNDSETRSFGDIPAVSRRCQEEIRDYRAIVGPYVNEGLVVDRNNFDDENIGVAALRKF